MSEHSRRFRSQHSPVALAPAWPRTLVTALAGYAVIGGVITIAGWLGNMPRLTSWKGDGISMFPNTAVCAVGSGVVLLLHTVAAQQWRAVARVGSSLVLILGLLTLVEHLIAVDFGIDTLLSNHTWGQTAAAAPMRMGPPASISFIMIGTALLFLGGNARARRSSAVLGVIVSILAFLSLTGHLYGAQQMYTIPRLTGIAMQTASMILALGCGLVASVPEHNPMRSIVEPSAAGLLTRRALPIIVIVALSLGWVRVFIQDEGLVDTAFGTALRSVTEVVLLLGLLSWVSPMIRAYEWALRDSEAEVRRQAAQLETFLETAAICLHRVGPDGIILWANDAELQTFGFAREEYIGHHVAEFHIDQAVIADILARLHRGESLFEYPAQIRCKDGTIKSVLIDSSVLWDEGRFVHTQSFTRDITAQQRAAERERQLHQEAILANAHFRAFFDQGPVFAAIMHIDGTLIETNRLALEVSGFSREQVIGKRFWNCPWWSPSPALVEQIRSAAATAAAGETFRTEMPYFVADGSQRMVDITILPVRDEDGRVLFLAPTGTDITERKRLEHELRQLAADLSEANRQKDEFLAMLAHELRNPLAPIRNALHTLRLNREDGAHLPTLVAMMDRQVDHMVRLIDDLLDVSRISRGKVTLRRETLELGSVIHHAVESVRPLCDGKAQTLTVALPPHPVYLHGDPVRLAQVIGNLLNNASKYTGPGGTIRITTEAHTDKAIVRVRDNGIGIAPHALPLVFDMFMQVDTSLERAQSGLGIGLTLVKMLVEMHGGTVEAHSDGLGHGSEFVVHLAAVAAASSPAPPVVTPRAGASTVRRRVLIVDDNRDAAESLAMLFDLAGHEARAAFDGRAALDAAAAFQPKVAVIDIGLPGLNGYEVARHIRTQPWGAAMILIALTGWGQDEDRMKSADAGFDAHLVKPVDVDELMSLLDRMR